jgi:uncharacterized membrane protein
MMADQSLRRVAGILLVGMALCGCRTGPAENPPAAPAEVADVEIPEAILNARYLGIYDEPVTLENGRFVGPPFVPGGASRPTLTLLPNLHAGGDLDGDGLDEQVVVLAESSGGSGTFIYLAVMSPRDGQPANIATALVGDRIRIRSLAITDAEVKLTMDPTGTSRSWGLLDDRLLELQTLSGHLVYGHEARSFEPCGSDETYWVVDATQGDLPEVYRALAGAPYAPLFAVLRGTVAPASGTGFAADHNEQIRVTRLRRAARETAGCNEKFGAAVFRARGVEPFWRLDVTATRLELSRIGEDARSFEIGERSATGGTLEWSATDSDGEVLTVRLDDERCQDPMSGSLFPYSAHLTVFGEQLKGCGLDPPKPRE